MTGVQTCALPIYAAGGTFRPLIDRVMPLGAAAEAHRLLEDGATLGKVILDPTR